MVRNYKKKGTRSGEVDKQAMLKVIDEVVENRLFYRYQQRNMELMHKHYKAV